MALFRRLWRTKGSLLSLAVLMTLFWILFLSGPSLPGQTSEQQVVNSNVPASEGPARQDLNSFGEELDSPRPEDSVVPQMDPSLAVRPGSGGIVQQASPLHGRLALELKRSLRQVEDFKDKVKAQHLEQTRVKATFIALARNSELTPMLHTMAQIEATFNKEYRYPYLFLNDEEFSEEFKRKITASTKAPVQFAIVPKEHWSVPSFISTEKLRQRLKQMEADSIPYGGLESYRHMCRFYSGFFYKHPALLDFDYYWRVDFIDFTKCSRVSKIKMIVD